MNKIVSLCKKRGFIFQSSEIYGGINSCWDYGPVGIELKLNIKNFWWRTMTYSYSNIVGIDASILMHPLVWHASGHVNAFTDPLVDCKNCKHRFRADAVNDNKCPDCGGELTQPRNFNLMFKTFMGPVEDEASIIYLRPETAQGIYVNFLNVLNSSRLKIPCGIAQIGKAFRNEITPGNFIFRTREFEQMEMQFFINPKDDEKYFEFWKQERWNWYIKLGINPDKLRFYEHQKNELAHYAKKAFDIQYEFPFGWQELEGIHNRTDFDLKNHSQFSKKDLQYFDDETKEKFIPYIIETSAGCDRTLLVTLIDAYTEEKERVVLKFKPFIAPIKVAVFPLVNRDNMPEIAFNLYKKLMKKFKCFYDDKGSIGRRYRRQDEIGTPFCITIDSQTLQDNSVTLRDRDTMEQVRYNINEIENIISSKLEIDL
ncbi:MAG TPA: glycine--tRNA ligase [bacterium]|nr:glycine--tRNA ligase [bacterium]HOL46559.1 glycine--tRNA ligase [bacterium]HPQ17870.1 glycine--tRNA ligase [bacterium]